MKSDGHRQSPSSFVTDKVSNLEVISLDFSG